MSDYRYYDDARKLGESLGDIELTPVAPPRGGALEAIANNKTAFADHQANREAAVAAVPDEMQKADVKRRLHKLLVEKQHKTAARELVLERFSAEASKLANPMTPDVSASAMTSGSGSAPDKPEREPVAPRGGGAQQGPAANLIARSLKAVNEQKKTAASRLDKEVRLGNVSYHDADPSIPKAMGSNRFGKVQSRANAFEPTAASTLARRQDISHLSHAAHIGKDNIVGTHLPGVGPATDARVMIGQPKVHAPHSSGQFMRAVGEGGFLGRIRALAGTANEALLPKANASDKTLGRAVLGHELAERQEMLRSGAHGVHLHASHFGVRPILEENIHLQGDPQAVKAMQKARQAHPDDALVARLNKQIGHHPDAPLPVGGRHERALERRLSANSAKLHSGTKMKAVQGAMNQAQTVAANGGNAEQVRQGIGLFKTIPNHVQDEVAGFHGVLGKARQGMSEAGPGVMAKARGAAKTVPSVLGGLRRMAKIKW